MRADALVRSVQSLVATTERSGDVGGSWRVRIGLQRPAMKRGAVGRDRMAATSTTTLGGASSWCAIAGAAHTAAQNVALAPSFSGRWRQLGQSPWPSAPMSDIMAIFTAMSFARTTDKPIPTVTKTARSSTRPCRSDQRFMAALTLSPNCVEDKAGSGLRRRAERANPEGSRGSRVPERPKSGRRRTFMRRIDESERPMRAESSSATDRRRGRRQTSQYNRAARHPSRSVRSAREPRETGAPLPMMVGPE